MSKLIRSLRLLLVLAVAGAAGYLFSGNAHLRELLKPSGWETARDNRELFLRLKQNYSLDGEELKDLFSSGLVDQFLNDRDPHSDLLSPEEFRSFEKGTNQQYEGIGVQISRMDDGFVVTRVFASSPAERAGLQPGDLIFAVDGGEVRDLSIAAVVERIQGRPGTPVTLSVKRHLTGDTLELVPTRSSVVYPSIAEASVLPGKVGLIKVSEFGRRTGAEFGMALKKLEEQGIDALIIDLRGNPGGMLTAAVEVAEQFLARGEVVVELRGSQRRDSETYRARMATRSRHYPIGVLLNRGSASASEIVAGALRASGKATLIGERSYGKGSIQSVFALSNGEGLKMTTARYFFADGSSIEDGVGLEPDLSVPLSRDELYQLRLQEFHKNMTDPGRFREQFGFEPVEDRQVGEARQYLLDKLAGAART